VSLAADKIAAGSLLVGNFIQSSNYLTGTAGWRISGDGFLEFRNSDNTRILYLNASGSQSVLRVGSALNIQADGTAFFAGSLSAATGTFAGSLSAATGTFAGSLSAATGTFAGALVAATGSFSTSTSGKRITLNESGSNEARFYGDRGDGAIELLASIGITTAFSDSYIGYFGSANSTRVGVTGHANNTAGVIGRSASSLGVQGVTSSGIGVLGEATTGSGVQGSTLGSSASVAGVIGRAFNPSAKAGVWGDALGSGVPGVHGISLTGYGVEAIGNATRAPVRLGTTHYNTPPVAGEFGGIALIQNPNDGFIKLCFQTNIGWVTFNAAIVPWNA
jgi:hypothetical protein